MGQVSSNDEDINRLVKWGISHDVLQACRYRWENINKIDSSWFVISNVNYDKLYKTNRNINQLSKW